MAKIVYNTICYKLRHYSDLILLKTVTLNEILYFLKNALKGKGCTSSVQCKTKQLVLVHV